MSLWFSRTDTGFRGWFQAVRSTGELRTGATSGSFTFVVVSPDDSGSQEFFVSESQQKPGLYYADINAPFLIASGLGDYGVSVELNIPSPQSVIDAFGSILKVSADDFDSISGSIEATVSGNVNLTPASIAAITSSVWEAAASDHNSSGTMGWLQNQIIDTLFSGSGVTATLASSSIDSIVNAVWDEPDLEHNLSGTMGFLQNLLDTINLRVSSSFVIVNSNLDVAVSTRATPGDSMSLVSNTIAAISASVWDAVDTDHTTSGTMGFLENLIDDINLKTSSSFVVINDNLDVPVSSRAAPGDSMSLVSNTIAAISASIWDATDTDHATSGTMGFLQNLIDDINIATSSSFTILTDLSSSGVSVTSIASASRTDIATAVWDRNLPGEHDASGTAGKTLQTAGTGGVDVDVLAAAVWDRLASSHTTTGTMGALQNEIEVIRALMENNWELSGSQMVFYANDGVTPFRIFNLFDTEGDEFFSEADAPAERVLTSSLQ